MNKSKSGRHQKQAIPQARNGAQLKPVKGPFLWESMEQFYQELVQLCRLPIQLRPLIGNVEAVARLENPDDVKRIVNCLADDTEVFVDKLQAIHAQHAGKTGEAADMDDQVAQLSISEQYLAWKDQFDSVILPNVMYVQEQFQSIEATAS